MQARAAEDLKRLVCQGLTDAGLAFESAEAFATPRRLALVVDGLPKKQPDQKIERKGPRVDAPEKAIDGFLGSVGLTLEQVETRETSKGEFYFAVIERKGERTAAILPELFNDVFSDFPWPKSMRWGTRAERWVRPLQSILCVFDRKIVDDVAFNDEPATNMTTGHRFMAPAPIKDVTDFDDYRKKLRKAYVILDAAERCKVIEREAARIAKAEGLAVKPDPALVAENAGLVEWPVVLMGEIDPAYMDVPPEVLTTAMRHHLKHFALVDTNGNLAPRFLVVSNMKTKDGGKQIIAGNERVLRARLADAKFFWDQDRKRTLESRVGDLDGIVFHAKLGSLGEKVRRIEVLAANIAELLSFDADATREAARLCKADLTTEMVGEFPELQGVMGRYYALDEGKPAEVADAIAEHYSPAGPNDDCPNAPVSVAVALADKIDTLVGFFAIDEKPTGSKDPYALRRAALGVIRLVVENNLRIQLAYVARQAILNYPDSVRMYPHSVEYAAARIEDHMTAEHDLPHHHTVAKQIAWSIVEFITERLKVHLKEKGVRHDLIAAVFALGGEDDLVRLLARVDALDSFLGTDDGEHLLTAYRRAANIVRIEEKRDGARYDEPPIADLFVQDEETSLHNSLTASATASSIMLENKEFSRAMSELAQLRGPVDRFFDEVTVNCDKPKLRENRLRLLSTIQATMNRVADFSKIEGGER